MLSVQGFSENNKLLSPSCNKKYFFRLYFLDIVQHLKLVYKKTDKIC